MSSLKLEQNFSDIEEKGSAQGPDGSIEDSRKKDYGTETKSVEETDKKVDHLRDEVPDGGLRAWMTVAGAVMIQFCGFGYTNTFGVYQDYYTRVYITNSSSSSISWIGSVNAFLVIVSGLYTGVLYDRGYFYHLLYGGSFLVAFSLFMLSLTQSDHLWQNFLAQGVGLGIGGGMMYVPSIAVLSQYFNRRRTLAMTVVASGSSLGSIIHPIMLNNLFRSRLGFHNSVRQEPQ